MSSSTLLLLQEPLFSILLLILISHCTADSISTTLRIRQVTDKICGITSDSLRRKFRCPKFLVSAVNSSSVLPSIQKTLSGGFITNETFYCVLRNLPDVGTPQFWSEIINWLRVLSQNVWETLQNWNLSQIKWKELLECCFSYAIPVILFGMLCGGCYLCSWFCCCKVKDEEEIMHYSFDDITTMTSNFHNRLSVGKFGKTFLGIRLPDEHLVAVKYFNTEQGLESERVFKTELETLSRARHRCIIWLIGYCTEHNKQILVFDFMARGNLYLHLHPKRGQPKSELFSSWQMRMRVLLDVAEGIQYLHQYAIPQIIHRDIKAANILIDADWAAKLSDFGNSVFVPEPGQDYVEVEAPHGTAGYLDPECNVCNHHVTPQNDVYSFGVVMLEVVTGQRSINKGNNLKLVDSAAPEIISGDLMKVLDKRLVLPEGQIKAVTRIAQLATECVRVPGGDRPDMGTIVTELGDALTLYDLPDEHEINIRQYFYH